MKKEFFFTLFNLLFIFSFFCGDLSADFVYLKNGREIEGNILREDEEKIWVLTYNNAKIGIKKSEIDSIESEDFVLEESKGGNPYDHSKSAKKDKKKKTGYTVYTAEVTSGESKGKGLGSELNVEGTPYTIKEYKDGELIGMSEEYYQDGSLKIRVGKLGGKRDGKFIRYYRSGRIWETGFYDRGLKTGLFKKYYKNTKLNSEVAYIKNKKKGLAKYYFKDGGLMREVVYVDNKQNGMEKVFYKNKQLLSIQEYKDNWPVGVGKKYYETGELQEESYPEIGMSKTYYQTGELKDRTFIQEDRFIEYNKQGNITYDGPIPEGEVVEDRDP